MSLSPGDDLQTSISGRPEGTTCCLAGGQTAQSTQASERTTGTACRYNEDVYFDDCLLTRAAFKGSGTNAVTLQHLVIEKFANPAQTPAVAAGSSWTIRDSEIRVNHGIGIKCGSTTTTPLAFS